VTAVVASPRVIAGRGAAASIPELLAGHRVLAIASQSAAQRTGLADWLPNDAAVFHRFQPNPTADQAISAAVARSAIGADLVIGVGGGSALDIAKAARALPGDPALADGIISAAGTGARAEAGLLLVPTTAGTGSEVTRFATIYRHGRKTSLDAACIQADVAVVDPALSESCPARLTWCCAFDAVTHAVESIWSTRATRQSRDDAMAALALLVPVLREGSRVPTATGRDMLSQAGTLAGRAIDVTRTTAAHALAYPLTVHLGIPHGLACALNLTWLAPMVEPAWRWPAATALRDVLGAPEGGIGARIADLLACRGLPTVLGPVPAALADVIVDEGLASDRVTGTPITLDRGLVRASVGKLLGRVTCDQRK
jgi:alcohol dehydrogenase class IV